MNGDELALLLTKLRAATAYALETAPGMLTDADAVRNLHDALPVSARPTWSETRELTTLLNEGE